MIRNNLYKALVAIAIAALIAGGFVVDAEATAIYNASAISSLVITDIDYGGGTGTDVTVSGEAVVDSETTDTDGDGVANSSAVATVVAGDPDDLAVNDRIDQSAIVSGSATTHGTAFSEALTTGTITVENNSAFTVTLMFDFDYTISADTSIDDPAMDSAYGRARVQINTSTGFFVLDEVTSLDGSGLDEETDVLMFGAQVFAGQTVDLSVTVVNSEGTAAVAPEPSTIALFGVSFLSLIGYGWFRRKKNNQ